DRLGARNHRIVALLLLFDTRLLAQRLERARAAHRACRRCGRGRGLQAVARRLELRALALLLRGAARELLRAAPALRLCAALRRELLLVDALDEGVEVVEQLVLHRVDLDGFLVGVADGRRLAGRLAQLIRHFGGARVAVLRLLGERAIDDALDACRNRRIEL